MNLVSVGLVMGLTLCFFEGNKGASTFLTLATEGLRSRRMALDTDIKVKTCEQIGRTCYIARDAETNPKIVTYTPCCQQLTCQGMGPLELKSVAGMAHHSSYTQFTGICTLTLDNGGGDLEAYKSYVKTV